MKNITFKDISVIGNQRPLSNFSGLDSEHRITDVIIQNLRFNNQPIQNSQEAGLTVGPFVDNIQFYWIQAFILQWELIDFREEYLNWLKISFRDYDLKIVTIMKSKKILFGFMFFILIANANGQSPDKSTFFDLKASGLKINFGVYDQKYLRLLSILPENNK